MDYLIYRVRKWNKYFYLLHIIGYNQYFFIKGKVNLNRVELALNILGFKKYA